MIRYGILVIIILTGIKLTSYNVYARGSADIVYRPVTLVVLDSETQQPLEGITVFAVNIIGYSRFFITDFISKSVVHFYEYMTDENGVVEIPQFSYKVNRYHYIDSQRIDLNIELTDKNIKINEQNRLFFSGYVHDGGRFIRSRDEYKAGRIRYHTFSRDFVQPERSKPYSTFIFRRYEISGEREGQTSFPSEHEEVTFYLERFSGEVSSRRNDNYYSRSEEHWQVTYG